MANLIEENKHLYMHIPPGGKQIRYTTLGEVERLFAQQGGAITTPHVLGVRGGKMVAIIQEINLGPAGVSIKKPR